MTGWGSARLSGRVLSIAMTIAGTPEQAPAPGRLTIHHYGPDPAYVGGMGSVIRVLTEGWVGVDALVAHPTWRPDARLASIPLALRAGLRMVRQARQDIVHVHLAEYGSFVREGGLVVLAHLLRKPVVVTIHGADFLAFARRYGWLATLVLARADVVTCLDEEVASTVRTMAPRTQVERVPNPVSTDLEAKGAAGTEEVVVFGGEIGRRKGADVLSRAWPIVAEARPHARCVVVGPPGDFVLPPAERLEARGPVDADAMRGLIRTARVIALPSRAEGMPMILTEAMSMGRPFVSTPVGGIAELAESGGVLVSVEDHVGLAGRLIDFLADPKMAQDIGERGRGFCLETRSLGVIGVRLRELYLVAGGN
jgi:glycosyltransferase involved in cell wall biosynthesis